MKVIRNDALIATVENLRFGILDGGYAICGKDWHATVQNAPFTRLYFIFGGDACIEQNGKILPLEAQKCYVIPEGASYRYYAKNSMEQLYFHLSVTDKFGISLLQDKNRIYTGSPDWKRCTALANRYQNGDADSHPAIYSEVLSLTLSTLGDGALCPHKPRSRSVMLALDYIQTHLTAALHIHKIAAECFVSPSSLTKRFKEEVGIPIGRFINERLLEKAGRMLTGTDLSLLEISETLGFCDQFYFSKCFKQKFSETPSHYRKTKKI